MDPMQCYAEMTDAMNGGDRTTARERALSLQGWLDRGGFCPPGRSQAEVRSSIADVLRRTGDAGDERPGTDEGGDA